MTDVERLRSLAVGTLVDWMSGYSRDSEHPQLRLNEVANGHGAVLFAVTDTDSGEITAVKVSVSVEEIA